MSIRKKKILFSNYLAIFQRGWFNQNGKPIGECECQNWPIRGWSNVDLACAYKTWLIVLIAIALILTISIIFILSYTLTRCIASLKANRWNITGLMANLDHFDQFWPILATIIDILVTEVLTLFSTHWVRLRSTS